MAGDIDPDQVRAMTATWLRGLLRRRRGRIAGVAFGVAVAVALLATFGSFLGSARATMTERAARDVVVDWQIQASSDTSASDVLRQAHDDPRTTAAEAVSFVDVAGFDATAGGTHQRTGAGVVLGISSTYRATFPGEIRTLTGTTSGGAMVAQQTAANLHVAPGDSVQIQLPGGHAARVPVSAVVELPQADTLFQRVGAPSTSQPIAPPDNVVLLPQSLFNKVAAAPGLAASVTHQVHTKRSAPAAHDPATAFAEESAAANNFESRLSGAAVVGDNLAAALDASREDAAYATVLFLFLGTPGAILAGLVTAAAAGAGTTRRRHEQALLRTRGATRAQVLRLAALEGLVMGLFGAAVGLLVAYAVDRSGVVSATNTTGWAAASAAIGVLISTTTVLLPVRRELRGRSVGSGLAETTTSTRAPWFARWGLDVALITTGLVVLWFTSRNGYKLVLAPEGVPSISVSYWGLAAPLLLWVGGALLIWRLTDLALRRGSKTLASILTPLAGRLSRPVAAGMGRQRTRLVHASVLLALAISFAISTSVFNATYRTQAEVDAKLTNGGDVAVELPVTADTTTTAAQIETVPGASSVEPVAHRFAYVGNDLQDIYGVRPNTIVKATSLQDSYFVGGSADQLMSRLASQPNAVLVSAETVKDFQLSPGDHLRLRLKDNATGKTTRVPFVYVGVANEFPTAPKDSFLVANASYLKTRLHGGGFNSFLVDTSSTDSTTVAHNIQQKLGSSAHVTDIATVRGHIGSSLTSVDLGGLSRVELTAALFLAAAASGLVLALGLAERRRTYAIVSALGGARRTLVGFIAADASVVLTSGIVLGGLLGAGLAITLVKVLTGVFDPPPATMTVPSLYLATAAVVVVAATAAATIGAARWAGRDPVQVLRDL